MDNFNDVSQYVRGKICMVTGGGGSIGGELVRQLAAAGAGKIIIVDIYENGAYEVACEVGDAAVVEIASVRDFEKMDYLMSVYCPNIVFHAAAHKHVPFMENSPDEAIKNNINPVDIMIDLSAKYGAENFMFISTDKAVEPISVMGISKRLGEMLVYEKSRSAEHTKFTTVRFGNVLNSSGSVLPLFRAQLKKGVITVTDKEAARYFITVRRAAEFALSALTIAEGGEIFIPDMGKEIKIIDLAEQVIREAGKEPYKDVEIKITGLRKGDKLREKLLYDFEKPEKTKYDNIYRVNGSSADEFMAAIGKLYSIMDNIGDRNAIREAMLEIINR